MGISTFVLILAAFIPIYRSAQERTRFESEAALLPQPQPITTEFETPQGPPKVFLVDHFFGKVGDAVLVHGENLGGLHKDSWVSLAGKKIKEDNLVSWTGSYIEFKVPEGAVSGRVEISILGKRTTWPGVFFVTDETTEAELRLKGEAGSNQAQLLAEGIKGSQELLVWLLMINSEGELGLSPRSGVRMEKKVLDLPIGRVYEIKLRLSSSITAESQARLVPLLTVIKTEEQMVGIARGELSDSGGLLKPLQAHPLYVSF
jgi:hypothetical protein